MGIGDWELGPIPNPQSPIPNPQSPIPIWIFYLLSKINNLSNLNINNYIILLFFIAHFILFNPK